VVDTIPTLAWSAGPDGSADFFNQRWLEQSKLWARDGRLRFIQTTLCFLRLGSSSTASAAGALGVLRLCFSLVSSIVRLLAEFIYTVLHLTDAISNLDFGKLCLRQSETSKAYPAEHRFV
jgi:hypothetical protein